MDARQLIQQHTVWQLGNGAQCQVFGQPWYGLWNLIKPSSTRQRRLTVSELLDSAGGWDNEKLIRELGFATALYISLSVKSPQLHPAREDRIVFSYAKNGQFTLRKAYQLLTPAPAPLVFSTVILKAIWRTGGLLPRIRVFLWKAMHNSLPVGDVLGRRISNTPRPCALCGDQAETVCHALFKCPWVRSLWMASSVGLRTKDLPDNVSNLLTAVFGDSEENRSWLTANHIWALWKLRCTEVYEGKKATPQKFIALAASYDRLETVAGLTKGVIGDDTKQLVQGGTVTCVVDGSFSMTDT
ncbi:Ribonuclease H-like superfamily protein [Rhynchospora pubera]|uniref:Ribonuclease H-like superfamily protein n=1 Tax=Rhynchospora pubera TaxID=906938 RepID=A0AAV8GZZ5_9POAL|nr:Ribonuclease H-like superfamily protein [Rhynchospora pubera]